MADGGQFPNEEGALSQTRHRGDVWTHARTKGGTSNANVNSMCKGSTCRRMPAPLPRITGPCPDSGATGIHKPGHGLKHAGMRPRPDLHGTNNPDARDELSTRRGPHVLSAGLWLSTPQNLVHSQGTAPHGILDPQMTGVQVPRFARACALASSRGRRRVGPKLDGTKVTHVTPQTRDRTMAISSALMVETATGAYMVLDILIM